MTKADNVKLLRAVACVQVKKGVASAANGLNDFTVQSITVNKGSDCGYLTPTNYLITITPVTGRPLSGSTFELRQRMVGRGNSFLVYLRAELYCS